MDEPTFHRAFEIAEKLEEGGLPDGVRAVTVGNKRTGGATTNTPAIVFLVDRKVSADEVHPAMLIPAEIEGFATDVVEAHVQPHNDENDPYRRVEPLVGGLSISAERKSSIGTLGAVFCNRTTRKPMGVTNWHVVGNRWFARNPVGNDVYQPTKLAANRIGTVWRTHQGLDCAAIALDEGARPVDRVKNLLALQGRINAIEVALPETEVFKVGARTGHTKGVIKSSGPSAVEIRPLPGREQDTISEKGDSGAIWLAERNGDYVALALHWGGDVGEAYAKPMFKVAAVLELDVL